MPDPELPAQRAIVTVVEMTNKPKGLHLHCEQCEVRCDHIAAVLGMVLDDKLTLGLSAPPDPSEPIENLTEDELLRRALADRQERAAAETMTLRSLDADQPWTDYTITSRQSGKTYRVSLRGFEPASRIAPAPTSASITWEHVSMFCMHKPKSRSDFPRSRSTNRIGERTSRSDSITASS